MNHPKLQALLTKRFSVPKERAIKRAFRSFTDAERAVFYFMVCIFIASGLGLLWKVNSAFLVEVPIRGGKLVEGVIGNPRFINPVLAISEADKNLSALVYSGLVKSSPGKPIENDLAEDISVSDNGRTYTATLKEEARFHDGEPVTADDIIFTIQKITDPLIKSPRRGHWEGVTIEKLDERTVAFHLKKPYAPFLENLTVGILPKHIWKNVSEEEFTFSQYNTLPIGSGPYLVDRVERNSGGIPNYYVLKPFDKPGKNDEPYIKSIIFRFYPSETALMEAFDKGEVESLGGITPEKTLSLKGKIISAPLPRVFGVFFNQSNSKTLLAKEVRQALDLASPKESIVANVLGGYGTPIDGPLPPGVTSWSGSRALEESYEERFQSAVALLARNGWSANAETGVLEKKSGKDIIELSFSISTSDAPELKAVADELVSAWQRLGARVEILVFETGDLNQNVIRPRKFEALLFGEVIGREADPYPFWHSSQRNDPGLNIALYANPRVDRYLDEARSARSQDERERSLKAFYDEIRRDLPAIFLYSPSYLYVVPHKVQAVSLGSLSASHDRFSSIRDWYIETDRVWKIFVN